MPPYGDLEAAWEAVSTRRPQPDHPHGAAATGRSRGKLVLAVVLMLLAGCSLGVSNSLPPASFSAMLGSEGVDFTVAEPEPGVVDPASVVRELAERPGMTIEIDGLSRRHPFVQTQAAAPIFGLLRCTVPGMLCATFDLLAGSTKGYYLVLYPEWVGTDGDIAWALVDAHLGVNHGHSIISHDPRQ